MTDQIPKTIPLFVDPALLAELTMLRRRTQTLLAQPPSR